MLTISGLLIGLLMMLTGMGYWDVITGVVFGLAADLILKSAEYKNAKREIIAHGVFSIWVAGNFIPIIITRDSYYQTLLSGYGKEYADTLMNYMPDWILPVLFLVCLLSGLIGGLLGRKIFKKHFERAGIA